MARVDGNLKYNLLMHRRLFLTDTSILLTPPLLQLLADSNSEYRIFLQDGSIVPAMRPSANSFADVARQVIKGGNYAELSEDDIQFYAGKLDGAGPRLAYTDPANQDLMNDLAGEALIQPDYWTREIERPFPQELANDLTRSVMEEMREHERTNFRQTEFWHFAEKIHRSGASDLSQIIRVEATIHSLGVMAINFNIPLIVPAPYAQPAGRVYGTGSPIREAGDSVVLGWPTEGEVREAKRAIYLVAQELTPQQIYEIRQSVEFQNYVRLLEKADRLHEASPQDRTTPEDVAVESANLVKNAFLSYRDDLNILASIAAEGKLQKRRFLQKVSKTVKVGGPGAPIVVGYAAHQMAAGSSMDPDLVTNLARGAAAACVWMVNKYGPSKMIAKEESRAQVAQARIRRNDHVKVEFFGPVDDRYWWLYGDEPPE
ncbi:hypothetical protein [Streptomyces violaceusniger]|uniref:Uncharacterized protein n=1 Tax=Streptomyces violaceusniger TaxID=68280 RepID=A0A4D4LBN8_STRVO|nr:hypothetical protein SVIO_072390 [Streptomyces violaceusniger]